MTIKQQIDYIMGHPYMGVALRDEGAMRKLLFEVHFHVYSVCAMNGAKVFRRWRDMTDPVIYEAIRDMEPPLELDVRLPFVKAEPVVQCAIVPLRVVRSEVVITKTRVRFPSNPFQIEIEFPHAVLTADLMEG